MSKPWAVFVFDEQTCPKAFPGVVFELKEPHLDVRATYTMVIRGLIPVTALTTMVTTYLDPQTTLKTRDTAPLFWDNF